MANNQGNENNIISNDGEKALDEKSGFEVSDQGQNLGGGKGENDALSGNNQHAFGDGSGSFDDEDEFSKTDQSIAQVAPGQTTTYTDQGGS